MKLATVGIAGALLAAAFVLVVGTGVADRHDPCAHMNGQLQAQSDVPDEWISAVRLKRPFAGDFGIQNKCRGEMQAADQIGEANDDHDWYYFPVAATAASETISVQLCTWHDPRVGMETSEKLYFMPYGDLLPALGLPSTGPLGTVRMLLEQILSDLYGGGPGMLMDESGIPNAQGCDVVTASVDGSAALGRWYLDVHRDANDGGYWIHVT